MTISRRTFIITATVLGWPVVRHASAQAGPVLESDTNAQALGYRTDASTQRAGAVPM
jgi:hypothetical protein